MPENECRGTPGSELYLIHAGVENMGLVKGSELEHKCVACKRARACKKEVVGRS
jgi:hypothetical protein